MDSNKLSSKDLSEADFEEPFIRVKLNVGVNLRKQRETNKKKVEDSYRWWTEVVVSDATTNYTPASLSLSTKFKSNLTKTSLCS